MAFLETRAPHEVMESVLLMSVSKISFPGRMNAAKRGIEYITPRINWFIGWEKYYKFTGKTTGDSKPLTPKVEATAQALAYSHDLDEDRIERIKKWSASHSWKTYLRFEEDFKKEFKPTLIEWMLSVTVYYDTYKTRREDVNEYISLGRSYKTMLRERGFAETGLTRAKNEEDAFRKYLETQHTHLEKRIEDRLKAEERLNNVKDEMEEFEEQYGVIAERVREQVAKEKE